MHEKMSRVKVTVVPMVIGALGAVAPKLSKWLQQIAGTTFDILSCDVLIHSIILFVFFLLFASYPD